jgi:hypothetical protein
MKGVTTLRFAAPALALVTTVSACTGSSGSGSIHQDPSAAASARGAQAAPVASFAGSGNATTKYFKVAADWKLAWDTSVPAGFEIELFTVAGADRGQLVGQVRAHSGTTFVSEAGTFTLRVTARRAWAIHISGRH